MVTEKINLCRVTFRNRINKLINKQKLEISHTIENKHQFRCLLLHYEESYIFKINHV